MTRPVTVAFPTLALNETVPVALPVTPLTSTISSGTASSIVTGVGMGVKFLEKVSPEGSGDSGEMTPVSLMIRERSMPAVKPPSLTSPRVIETEGTLKPGSVRLPDRCKE